MNTINHNPKQTTEVKIVSIIFKSDFIAPFVHSSLKGKKKVLQKTVDLFSMCVELFGNLFLTEKI